jgi:U3 small nucleolar RNA-associated protein 25
VRNIIFYAPPDHADFYTEFLSFPFLDEGVAGEDVTVRVVYSKYDYMRLERIVGSNKVKDLVVV